LTHSIKAELIGFMKILAALLLIGSASAIFGKELPAGWSERYIDANGRAADGGVQVRTEEASSARIHTAADKLSLSKGAGGGSVRFSGVLGIRVASGTGPSPIKTQSGVVPRR
jgi:hypothetical protein